MDRDEKIFTLKARKRNVMEYLQKDQGLKLLGGMALDSAASVADHILMLPKINRFYYGVKWDSNGKSFTQRVLDELNVQFQVFPEDMKRIPAKGPVVVVANHPFGMIEAIGLHVILSSVRSDVKFIANDYLDKIPEIAEFCFLVDPFGSKESPHANIKPMKEAIRWLRSGGMIVIFPAGEVASFNMRYRRITDPEWSHHAARLIRLTQADALPVFFKGANSPIFHLSGMIHPRLRTALLPYEFLNKRGKKPHVVIGNPIPNRKLTVFGDDAKLIAHLRNRTYFQENRIIRKMHPVLVFPKKAAKQESLGANVPVDVLANEIDNLPLEQKLVEARGLSVFHATERQAPSIVKEIGRLREITFRKVGEGSGKSYDLDEYDTYYEHLFIWNPEKQELVGAYRFGKADEILHKYGRKGLYTTTLFRFNPGIFELLGDALELGRSFVRPEYQRTGAALPLLWKGVGGYVVRNPKYKYLFGPVSISNEYQTKSHQLIVRFLKQNCYSREISKLVKSRKPYRSNIFNQLKDKKQFLKILEDVEDLSAFITDLENDGKGIPILLKEYLKLGGKLLGFNVDRKFSNVIDGLILVDLTQTDRRILDRYMKKEGAEGFLRFHG